MDSAVTAVKARIDVLLGEKGFVIIVIDRKCASGKTTLAGILAEKYDCNVFRVDDLKSAMERILQSGKRCRYLYQTDLASRIPRSPKIRISKGAAREFASANVPTEQPWERYDRSC